MSAILLSPEDSRLSRAGKLALGLVLGFFGLAFITTFAMYGNFDLGHWVSLVGSLFDGGASDVPQQIISGVPA